MIELVVSPSRKLLLNQFERCCMQNVSGDKNWVNVVDFFKQQKLDSLRILGPKEFRELGLITYPISASWNDYDCVILHKGLLNELELNVIERIHDDGIPVFANEVFVVFSKKWQGPTVLKSIHFKSFIERLKSLKQQVSVVESSTPARMAVYLGNHRALTTTIYGHKIFVDTRDLSLGPHILMDGYWEKWISNVFLTLVQPGMNVVDIGANIGFYSLLAAKNIGHTGTLTCFEANPELADVAFDNLHINGFTVNSSVINKAVYSEETTLEFNIYEKFLGSSSLWADSRHVEAYRDEIKKITVETVTLDSYFPAGHKIDFIKIDAEGAEPHILKGAKRILSENVDLKIMMEFAPAIIQAAYGSVEQFYYEIKDYGFNIHRINHDSSLQQLSLADVLATHHCDVVLKK